jgi:ribonucleoside-diphosphate reductase alpha chain
MLSMLFETGHPWITFKDPCNLRSPQQHVGVVHSSNLCTEITLNTSEDEIAVCNLGSVNMVAHLITKGDGSTGLDFDKLAKTVRTAMRMLDNVIDINYYAVDKAKNSNLRHRPVGMGIMGFQDCLHKLRIPYASNGGVEFADRSMEMVSYCAYWAFDRAGRGARPVPDLPRLAVGPGHPAAGHARPAGRRARRLRRARPLVGARLGAAARSASAARHAQLQLHRHRAHRDHRQHHRRVGLARADLPEPVREIEPVGRVHGGQRIPGVGPEARGPVGRGHDLDLKYFDGNLARIDRAPAELRRLYATAFEVEPKVAGRGGRAAPEVDRPVAVAQHLHGGRLGQEAGRDLQAGVDARPEDHLLPARDGRHARREVDQQGGRAECGASAAASPSRRRHRRTEEPKFCSIDNPECEACQ